MHAAVRGLAFLFVFFPFDYSKKAALPVLFCCVGSCHCAEGQSISSPIPEPAETLWPLVV